MHAVMVARRSLLPWPVTGARNSGMRAWQDTLIVRDLQLQEGCCISLASLQLSYSNDLLAFFLSCCKVIVPSTSILVFHIPLKGEGDPSSSLSQVFPTAVSCCGFTPA